MKILRKERASANGLYHFGETKCLSTGTLMQWQTCEFMGDENLSKN